MTAMMVIPKYDTLLKECQGVYLKAKKALVEAYWDLGKKLNDALGKDGSMYGAGTIAKLADDLRTDKRNLERARVFARKFKKGDLLPGLGWSHYIALLSLPSEKGNNLAVKIDEKGLSVKDTKKEVSKVQERKFRGEPELKAAVAVDKLFNRLFGIPDPEELIEKYKNLKVEQKFYDRFQSKIEMAEARVKGLRKLLKSIKTMPKKEKKK